MPRFFTTKQFGKDFKKAIKSGKSRDKIVTVLRILAQGDPLPARCRDHKLKGVFQGRRECHIESDLLLIYKLEDDMIVMERMGSHAELFE
ncbi:MAG TPA: type II toxin-antitoxin system YafQ family toxin [Candidatus Aminicenantes bacterium]|nr:type II toxin-antitoxin system YafQ family toxin [Candidatus Aminicenantes bacterium]